MFKKTLLALTISATAMSAQATNSVFEGPYMGATLSMLNLDADYKETAGSLDFSNDGTAAGVGVNLGYGGLNGSFYGAVEVAFKTNYGKAEDATGLAKINGKDGWELSLLPGFLINETSLIYGRIGMGSINGEVSVPIAGLSQSDDIDLTIWGLGFQKMFTENLSAKVEYVRGNFSKKESNYEIEGDSSGIILGAQYTF